MIYLNPVSTPIMQPRHTHTHNAAAPCIPVTLRAFTFKLIESEPKQKHDQVQINEPIIVSSIVLFPVLVSQFRLLSVGGLRGVRTVQHQFLVIKY